jgi:N-acetylmuramoyl-L-alanine amidase
MSLRKGRPFAELESPFLDEEIVGARPVALVEAPGVEQERGPQEPEEREAPAFSEECELDEQTESVLRARGMDWELADQPFGVGPVTEQQVPPGATVDSYGSYNLRAGNNAARFWPLAPGTTVVAATPPPPPGGAIRFAVVDVLIRVTADPRLLNAVPVPNLLAQVAAPAPTQSMPLVPNANGDSRICFGVPIAAGAAHFSGTLRLQIQRGPAPATTIDIDLPIRVAAGATVNNLVIFAVVQPGFSHRYAWLQLQAQRHAPPNAAIAGADVELKVLRDASSPESRGLNRRIALNTDANGFIATGGRNVIGVPIGWPLLLKATAAGFARRGHLVRLEVAQISNNLTPHVPATTIRMLPANANLAGRRIMLDAGHGVVYGHSARRSQEWFVNHRIIDRVAELLQNNHFVNAANIVRTRSAGFGLIEPGQVNAPGAPERGANRFAFDLARRRVRIAANAQTLATLSDLVLTTHAGAANAGQPVAPADRTRLLAINGATVAAIRDRLNLGLAPARRVRAGSVRWDAGGGRYVFTRETVGGVKVDDRPFPTTTADWWDVDDAMMDILIDRSARWSLRREIGSIEAQFEIPGHDFIAAARTAMEGAGALAYMRNKVRFYLPPVPAPVAPGAPAAPAHPWSVGGIMGWTPTRRRQFFNTEPLCHLYISVHANAGAGIGGKSLVSRALAAPNAPHDDQIRLAKIALKYLDPFDQGVHGGGISREEPGNATALLQGGNTRRDRYLYLETEFMDARNPNNLNQYRYEQMVEQVYIDRVGDQIVAAALEILLAPQGELDDVRLNNTFVDRW